ncbi:hypothetical protein MNV_1070036 [Candidatus Methanoperedens nitroreducens]|uniref:Uncharacterized protein n=1 Tax=Candidatus Methanoperedens nitratireducens TaxID=1392998 RepID=A0A284VIP3_9EURY|nr:hypothetical protein MNV_1070036 [Candidatus Methanoperedens nitroreducens]
MKKYIEIILHFTVAITVALVIGYLDNNLIAGARIGISIGVIFAILHYFNKI